MGNETLDSVKKINTSNLNSMNISDIREYIEKILSESENIQTLDLKGFDKVFNKYIEYFLFKMIYRDPFLSSIMNKCLRETSYEIKEVAGIYISNDRNTPTIVLNPILFMQFSENHQSDIILHEIMHFINGHLSSDYKNLNEYDSYLMNLAMDCAINQYLKLPEEFVSLDWINNKFKVNCKEKEDHLYYYENIKNSSENKKIEEEIKKSKDKANEKFDSLFNGKSDSSLLDKIKEYLDKIITDKVIDHSIHSNQNNEEDNSSLSNNIKNKEMDFIVEKFLDDLKNVLKGDLPYNIQERLNKLKTPPQIPWTEELKKICGSIRIPYKKTILRRSRRQPKRLDIKGRLSDRKIKLAVAFDTSGSISNKDAESMLNETLSIIKAYNYELDVYECDAKIQNKYKVKNEKDLKYEFNGRGGTAFSPIFEMNNGLTTKYDLIVYFSDGYGEEELTVKPHPYTKFLFVIHGDINRFSLRESIKQYPNIRVRKFKIDN